MSVAAALLALLAAPQPPVGPDLAAHLARAADRPTAAARREDADRLAREPGASLDDWLAACATCGRFEAMAPGRGVTAFALSLAAAQLGKDGAVEVRWQNRTQKRTVTPDAAVLLRDFVERFDRTRLPVARVEVR